MSRAAEVSLAFGGEDRLFRLPIGRLRALQEKTDCGPPELLRRFVTANWRVDDVRETIFQGLLGGGMSQGDATRLLQTSFDDLPLQEFVTIAQAVIASAIVGVEDEPLGEPAGEAAQPNSPSPEASSGSPGSTAPAPSSDTAPSR